MNFVSGKINFIRWMKYLKFQIKLLRFYDVEIKDYMVLANMKKYLYSLALTKYKETEYMQYYDIYNHTSNDWKKCRREANELLEYLYFQEEKLNKEFELYRRGSKSFRQEEENKWLKNVVKARLC